MKAKRRLQKVNVSFISLVDKGANQKVIIYKSADHPDHPEHNRVIEIKKYDEEQGIVYGIVYSPEQVDSQGDIASADVIKEMAYEFLRAAKTSNVDKQHDYDPDEGYVAESWITKENDPVFPDDPVGSWAVALKVEKEETKEAIKKGELTGLSLAGQAVVEAIKSDEPENVVGLKAAIKEVLTDVLKAVGLKKDFNEEIENETVRKMFEQHMYALHNANWKVMDNEDVTDKKAALIKNATQFIESLEALEVKKSQNINDGEIEMKPEEIKELVKSAVDEAVKHLNEKIGDLEKSVKDEKTGLPALAERVEKVEKATPGSKQPEGEPDPDKVEKKNVRIWI